MANLTYSELTAFLATPEAQALNSTEEKMAAALEWKQALEALNTEPEAEFNPAEHIANLKAERDQWYKAKAKHPEDRYKKALARINAEIKQYEQALSS